MYVRVLGRFFFKSYSNSATAFIFLNQKHLTSLHLWFLHQSHKQPVARSNVDKEELTIETDVWILQWTWNLNWN